MELQKQTVGNQLRRWMQRPHHDGLCIWQWSGFGLVCFGSAMYCMQLWPGSHVKTFAAVSCSLGHIAGQHDFDACQ